MGLDTTWATNDSILYTVVERTAGPLKHWICLTSQRSLRIIRELGVYGVSSRDRKRLEQFRPRDIIFLFVPGEGIVGICQAISGPLRAVTNVQKYGYPHQVRIRFLWTCDKNEPLPIFKTSDPNITIEPAFTTRSISLISNKGANQLMDKAGLPRAISRIVR